MLVVLEEIARNQPIGSADLVRILDAEKSGVQRSLMTLVDAGWISTVPGPGVRWRLTSHIQVVAKNARDNDDLRLVARPALERLRDACGETVLLIVPDLDHFVVIDVAECQKLMRIAPRVGLVIPAQDTATARIILPYLDSIQQKAMLGREPSKEERQLFEATRDRGYAINITSHSHTDGGREAIGSANIGAPIFDHDGLPVAAIVISGPSERLPAECHERFGLLAAEAAREVSAGQASLNRANDRGSRGRAAAN
jgi:IclR family acetate operon transcriptional repressor